jgi:hypothetical protein
MGQSAHVWLMVHMARSSEELSISRRREWRKRSFDCERDLMSPRVAFLGEM